MVSKSETLDVVVVERLLVCFIGNGLFVMFHQFLDESALVLRDARIRRVADDDGEALVPFDFVHGGGFVGEGVEADERELFLPRFEGVGEVDAGAFLGGELVAGFGELEADFHVGDGVGGHHEFEGVEAGEERLWNVFVPVVGEILNVGF